MSKTKEGKEVPQYANVNPKKQDIIKQYLREKDYAVKLRQTKIDYWIKNEEGYNGVNKKTLLTRSNLHAPVLFDGVQTMSSKLGAVPDVAFDTIPEGNENASEIMKHVVKEDLDDCDFDLIYENSKIECGIYGRGIFQVIPGNDKQTVELVDTLSFLISPIAKNTKDSLYCGKQFIYKTIPQLEEEADRMEYDMEELQKVKENKVTSETQIMSSTEASVKNLRMANLGLSNVTQYGSKVVEITEWWTHLTNDDKTKFELYCLTVVNDMYLLRAKKASELGLRRMPFVSYGTYTRGITFWCPSVADIYRDINLAVDVNLNQMIDNNTYRNFGMMFVSSSSGLKQSSIVPRPLGITPIICGPNEKITDKVWQPEVPEINSAQSTMMTTKAFADTASGLSPVLPSGSKGKMSVTQQAALQAQVDQRISIMKRNVTAACQELFQLMADITADKLTKPRKVKIFGFKDLTIEDVTKKNFRDIELKARAIPSEDSAQNKAIKQKAKMELYQVFKDDPKLPGQLALRRSVAKSFDIEPDEIESWFTQEEQPEPDMTAMNAMPPAKTDIPPTEATPLLSQTQAGAQANVPPAIK